MGLDAFEDVLLAIADGIPPDEARADLGIAVVVTHVDLELPIESRFDHRGLLASAPRGRFADGFPPAHGRLTMRFERREG